MVGLARTVPGGRRRLPEANVWDVWLTPTVPWKPRRTMTGETRYRALFLGAGPQMHCGVGQFTRLLQETIEKLEPGSSATLTLTRRGFAARSAAVVSAQAWSQLPIVA